MNYKALSLYNPWASFVVAGIKMYETRSWATNHRGHLYIHVSKMPKHYYKQNKERIDWLNDLAKSLKVPYLDITGAIIGSVYVQNCYQMPNGLVLDDLLKTKYEQYLGDFSAGRFAWELVNAKVLDEPIYCKGKQRIWNYEK